ncbi:MAG: IPT/TIG domain-containing protein [Candidatus Nomurabacteria bacterium]|nr:IPT/TIG domain-containing protein [Candidatus Nomurabacteria bacterium]
MKKAVIVLVVAVLFGAVISWMTSLVRASSATGVTPGSGPTRGYDEVTINGLDIGIATRYVTHISAGYNHTLALTTDGKVYAWGRNNYGQLGDGTTTNHSKPVPVDMTGALAGKKVTQIAGGEAFSLALTTDGKVYAWGYNNRGQMGIGSTTNQPRPVAVNMVSGVLANKTVTQIAAGREFALVLTSDGKVFSWGRNYYGQAGNGSNGGNNTSPVATDMSGSSSCLNGKTVKQIAVGGWHSLALTTDGVLCSWGYNNDGQLGDGTTSNRSRPVAVNVTTSALADKTIAKISGGSYHTMVLDNSGAVYGFGYNNRGQLGDGTTTNRSTAVAVSTAGVLDGKTITDISAGGIDGTSLALGSDGKVYAWGYNNYGQLGIGSTSTQTTPVAVSMAGVLSGKTVTQIEMGYYHAAVLTNDGQVYSWGRRNYGQLGDDSTSGTATSPVATDKTYFDHVPLPLTITFGGKFCKDITTRANNITTHIASDGTSVQCLTPVHSAGLVDVTINDTVHDPSTLPQSYLYVSSGAAIGDIAPEAGATAGGSTITIEGVGFGAYDDSSTKFATCGSTSSPYQTFTAPQTATYKLEVWGAQGGTGWYSTTRSHPGGKGGYSVGEISLVAGEELNIFVGCKGQDGFINSGVPIVGGYNGGGGVPRMVSTGNYAPGGGGGGTDIRLNGTALSDRVIVAGGGGGGGSVNDSGASNMGGFGGGASAGSGIGSGSKQPYDGSGATTFSGGAAGGNGRGAGGGGSGYVGSMLARAQTLAGNLATIPDPTAANVSFMTGKAGDGYARVTAITKLPSVTVGGQDCPVQSWQDEAITCTVPAHAKGAVDVVLGIGGSALNEPNGYTYVDAPSVASVSPTLGSTDGGTGFGGSYNPAGQVTINGNGFQVPSSSDGSSYYTPVVKISGRDCANVVLLSNTQLTCVPPESGLDTSHAEGAAAVMVSVMGATGTLNNGYTYRAPLQVETICQVGTGTTTNDQIKCTTAARDSDLVTVVVDNGFDSAMMPPIWSDTGNATSGDISGDNVDSGWLYTGLFLSLASDSMGGLVSFMVNPSGTTSSSYDIITVQTNNGRGYNLSMATTDNRLTCTTLASCSSVWFNSITTGGALSDGTWGWNVDVVSNPTNPGVATPPSIWRLIPLTTSSSSDKLIYSITSPTIYTDNIGDKFRLWFGARASQAMPATSYTRVVTITAVANI